MPMSAFPALRGRRKRSVSRSSSSSPSPSSTTSSTSSSLTKTVCIRAISEEGQSNWFLVNVSFQAEEEESKKKSQSRRDPYDELLIRFFGRRHHHRPGVTDGNFATLDEEIHPFSNANLSACSSWASIGATLYCVGGVLPRRKGYIESDYSRVVRAYDLSPTPTHHGWTKNLSPMIRRRRTPRLAVLDDKLYAFGGVADGSLFAEVYDPIVDKWEALPQPSPTIRDNACFAAPLHGMKKIAVGFKSLYNAVTESWEIVEGLDGFTGEAPVTVGNTMYWFWRSKHSGSCIRAYDFYQMKLFEGDIKSFEHETLIWNAKTYLLHMGGDTFCMLWRSPPISQTKTQYHCTQLHVIKEEVSEEGSRGVLNARVLACQSFITPGKASICEAQTLGISLIEDNRQDEAIASLEVIGKNGGIILEMRTPQTTVV